MCSNLEFSFAFGRNAQLKLLFDMFGEYLTSTFSNLLFKIYLSTTILPENITAHSMHCIYGLLRVEYGCDCCCRLHA
jgi:hypothetical protein